MLVCHPATADDSRGGSRPSNFTERTFNTTDVVDMTILGSFDEVQEAGQPDFVVELIDLYLQEAPQRFEAIRGSVVRTDILLLKQAAHALKGSSASLGIRQVAEICEKLEHMKASDSQQSMDALLQLLEHKFAKARAFLLAERERRLRENSNS